VDARVIRATKALGKISIPGAMTPTEVAYAYECGADIVKMFPAGVLGAGYIKAVKAPLKHIPVVAVGGVNAGNCAEFIKAGAVGVGVGGNLVSPAFVNEGRFDEITAMAQEYTDALKGV
jgi:2-dehydro-3-deoxyphosphogluconate aldolase/(4S)-4-hydroxy-2-oxoglutarate aldolase